MRPTPMLRSLAVVALTSSLALAGCGSEGVGSGSSASSTSGGASATPSTSSPSATPSDQGSACAASGSAGAGPRARVDVDGDGTPETVSTAACGSDTVLRVAGGEAPLTATLPADEPPVQTIYGVRVPGRTGDLVVTRSSHPRGGFQLRVYAADASRLVELTRGTEPLVPFVATDVQEHPLSIGCAQDALVLTEAVPHEPAGVAFAWDVRRTTYALDGTGLTAGPAREVADNVLPAQLAERWADLVDHTAFAGCRAG